MSRRRVASSDAVLAVAAQLFERKGYQNTSVDDIAETLKIAKPTIYKYVKSKRFLLEATIDSLLVRLRADLQRVMKLERPDEQIEALIREFFDVVHDCQSQFMIFFGDERELPVRTRKRFRALAREITAEVAGVFRRAQQQGIVRKDVDPMIAAYFVTGMLSSLARWYDPKGRLDRDQLAEQARRILSGFYSPQTRHESQSRHPPAKRSSAG